MKDLHEKPYRKRAILWTAGFIVTICIVAGIGIGVVGALRAREMGMTVWQTAGHWRTDEEGTEYLRSLLRSKGFHLDRMKVKVARWPKRVEEVEVSLEIPAGELIGFPSYLEPLYLVFSVRP